MSCRDFHISLSGEVELAKVNTKILTLSEVKGVIPSGYSGEDSVVFVNRYIERWIRKQVKLSEAERLFLTSEGDIDARVEEYRQSLLIKRLEEFYVEASIDTIYTDSQIEEYYQNNKSNFKLSGDIVKGEVLRIPLKDSQTKRLKELFESSSSSKRKDLLSICEKNDFEFVSLTERWVEADELLDLLPMVRRDESYKVLSRSGVNHLSDDSYDYYYTIEEYKRSGDVAPVEWVRSTIRKILSTERQQNLIKGHEDRLYNVAEEQRSIERYAPKAQ